MRLPGTSTIEARSIKTTWPDQVADYRWKHVKQGIKRDDESLCTLLKSRPPANDSVYGTINFAPTLAFQREWSHES
jgi:hypothetical protein